MQRVAVQRVAVQRVVVQRVAVQRHIHGACMACAWRARGVHLQRLRMTLLQLPARHPLTLHLLLRLHALLHLDRRP